MKRSKQARAPEAKEARRQIIIGAARTLFSTHSFVDVTMAQIASLAGLAKGTVYLYFKSKEVLFLNLLLVMSRDWFETMSRDFVNHGPFDARVFAHTLTQHVVLRPDVLEMMGLTHNILAQKISVEDAIEFKQGLLALVQKFASELESVYPGFRPGDGPRFLIRFHALVVGLGHLANPGLSVKKAYEEKALSIFGIDFAVELEEMTYALLSLYRACESL